MQLRLTFSRRGIGMEQSLRSWEQLTLHKRHKPLGTQLLSSLQLVPHPIAIPIGPGHKKPSYPKQINSSGRGAKIVIFHDTVNTQ